MDTDSNFKAETSIVGSECSRNAAKPEMQEALPFVGPYIGKLTAVLPLPLLGRDSASR